MSPKMKGIFKKFAGWAAFLSATALLVSAPYLYWSIRSGSSDGPRAECGATYAEGRTTDLQDIILHPDYWNLQQITLSGVLRYSAAEETFTLRDGAFSLPLDVSDCQGLEAFKGGGIPVLVSGRFSSDGAAPALEVTDLRGSVPILLRILFTAGIFNVFFIMLMIVGGFLRLLVWLLTLIGVVKKRPAPSPEEMKEKDAGSALLFAIAAPLLWIFNPFAGAELHAYGLVSGWRGLASKKRRVASAGLILCGLGIVVMTAVVLGAGWLQKPLIEGYSGSLGNTPVSPTGRETLELKPYVSDSFAFSLHPPKGWTVNEKGGADSPIVFDGPAQGASQGKPFHPQIKTAFIAAAAIQAKSADDAAQFFSKELIRTYKDFSSTIESQALSGDRLDTRVLEATYTDAGVKNHALAVLAMKNAVIYFIGSSMPAEKWDANVDVIRQALMTLEIWDASFAACLKSKGAVFYGASTCDHCQAQKKLFAGGTERLPYVECNSEDGKSELDVCANKNIKDYPTWEFTDGSRLVGEQSLKALSDRTGCALPR